MSLKIDNNPLSELQNTEGIRVGETVLRSEPRVSVVIPAYNVAQYIGETLDSVFAQTFDEVEVFVVNDGSPDTPELENVLQPYFAKLNYIVQKNAGPGAARNNAIKKARGEFVAFVDGDDIWMPEKLEKQLAFLDENRFDMVYSNGELFGTPFFEGKLFMDSSPSSGEVTPESIISAKCNVLLSSNVVRRKHLLSAGGFDETVPLYDPEASGYEDFDLWFRLARSGTKIGYLTEPLIKYRTRAGNMTGSVAQMNKRTLVALDFIKNKYQLTASELKAREILYQKSHVNYFLELAKQDLIAKNYDGARKNLAKANVSGSFKLKVLELLATYCAPVLRSAFAKLRPAEFSFSDPRSARG